MMARLGKVLANLPGRAITNEELEQRVESIEAVVDGIVERVDTLELKADRKAVDRRDGK